MDVSSEGAWESSEQAQILPGCLFPQGTLGSKATDPSLSGTHLLQWG